MIEIRQDGNKISVSGHAEYAEHGRDIVCGAISTLSQVFVASVEELAAAQIKTAQTGGYMEIVIEESTERAQVLLDSFLLGCRMIAQNYPEYVQVLGGKNEKSNVITADEWQDGRGNCSN